VLFPCMYVLQPNWFISFSPLHSSIVLFPWWTQPV
jgi:hypothetical protein